MENIVDYLKNIKDVCFTSKPFNELDALVLSRLSYINFSMIVKKGKYFSKKRLIDVINDLFTEENSKYQRYRLSEDKELLNILRSSLRFKDLYLKSFIYDTNIKEVKQFSAISFVNKTKSHEFLFVAFKGTDGTLTGRKEDFNMAYLEAVPAQIEAAKYLKKMTRFTNYKTIYVGGHSKGGNLAIYASTMVRKKIQNNIKTIYSFDGPGFKKEFLLNKGFINIKEKILLFVPPSSIIGRLLYKDYKTIIVDSKKSLLYQHNIYNWLIENNGFITLSKYTFLSNKIDRTLKENLDKMSIEDKKEFVDSLFDIVKELSDDDIINFGDGMFDFFKRFKLVFKTRNKATQDLLKSIFTKVKEEPEIKYIEPIKTKENIYKKAKSFISNFKKKSSLSNQVIDYQEEPSNLNSNENILKLEDNSTKTN